MPRHMRVALYHPWIYLKGGAERVIVELVRRSRHDWAIFTHHYDPAATFPEFADFDVVELTPRISVRRRLWPLLRAAGTIARTDLDQVPCEGLLVSSEGLGDLVLARTTRLPAVCYCHTPLKILHDPATRRRLATQGWQRRLAAEVVGPAFHQVDVWLWRRYRRILANSMETAERLRRAGFEVDNRLEVLYPGVDTRLFRPRPGPRGRYFLVAGRIMWQKNIELAIEAMRIAVARGVAVEMVVAGAVDAKSEPYLAELRRRAAGLPVVFERDPDDERLRVLYARALAVIFPPLSEDWGLVPLEAMASGTPVLAVAGGGPVESVLSGVTGWLLPADPMAFAERMTAVAADPSMVAVMASAARQRAEAFDWQRFATRMDEVIEAVVAQGAKERPWAAPTRLGAS